MSRLTLTNDLIRDYVEHCGHARPQDGRLHVYGIRGVQRVSASAVELRGNVPDRWDDTVGLFGATLLLCRGTVDPGRHYTSYPLHPDGCAHMLGLDEGGHPYRYQRGLHQGHTPALVQAGPIKYWRDKDRDHARDAIERTRSGVIGANVHPGGTVTRPVGKWSAACQVVVREDWPEYWSAVVAAEQSIYLHYLLDGPKLARWVAERN